MANIQRTTLSCCACLLPVIIIFCVCRSVVSSCVVLVHAFLPPHSTRVALCALVLGSSLWQWIQLRWVYLISATLLRFKVGGGVDGDVEYQGWALQRPEVIALRQQRRGRRSSDAEASCSMTSASPALSGLYLIQSRSVILHLSCQAPLHSFGMWDHTALPSCLTIQTPD